MRVDATASRPRNSAVPAPPRGTCSKFIISKLQEITNVYPREVRAGYLDRRLACVRQRARRNREEGRACRRRGKSLAVLPAAHDRRATGIFQGGRPELDDQRLCRSEEHT